MTTQRDALEAKPDPSNWGRGNAGGRATRDLIIRTAEALFADRGIDAVSLREISAAAGQRNNGATQYHFGDREALIRAIFVYRSHDNHQRRLEILNRLEEQHRERDVRALVEALVRPVAEHLPRDDRYVGFLARLEVERGERWLTDPKRAPAGADTDSFVKLRMLLKSALAELSAAEFERRLTMVTMWLNLTLASYERAFIAGERTRSLEQIISELTDVLSAVLQAPRTKVSRRRTHS